MNVTMITEARMAADAVYSQDAQDASRNRASFNIYNYYYSGGKNCEEVIHCTAWGRLADSINRAMSSGRFLKGCRVEVMGEMHMITYTPKTGKNAGREVSMLQINNIWKCQSWPVSSAAEQPQQSFRVVSNSEVEAENPNLNLGTESQTHQNTPAQPTVAHTNTARMQSTGRTAAVKYSQNEQAGTDCRCSDFDGQSQYSQRTAKSSNSNNSAQSDSPIQITGGFQAAPHQVKPNKWNRNC